MSRTRSLATPIRKMILPPSPTPCVSHWQATNRGPTSLFGHNALPSVRIPERADLVIIGGGTMGASLAYFLTRQNDWAGRSMVVLEARDVASGASGRNGVSPPSFPCPLADVSCTLCRAISDRQPAKRSSSTRSPSVKEAQVSPRPKACESYRARSKTSTSSTR